MFRIHFTRKFFTISFLRKRWHEMTRFVLLDLLSVFYAVSYSWSKERALRSFIRFFWRTDKWEIWKNVLLVWLKCGSKGTKRRKECPFITYIYYHSFHIMKLRTYHSYKLLPIKAGLEWNVKKMDQTRDERLD